jgi:chemosensory pili system protein ChpC
MKAPQRIEQQKLQEIASLLIPLQGVQLLVPNVTVAEIVPVSQVLPVDGVPDWYLGNCIWREQRVPLVSYEAMNGNIKGAIHSRARFAVFNTTGTSDQLPFLAMVTQGLPRLARVNEEEISAMDVEQKSSVELMHVAWAGEEAVIPDVAAMEAMLLSLGTV